MLEQRIFREQWCRFSMGPLWNAERYWSELFVCNQPIISARLSCWIQFCNGLLKLFFLKRHEIKVCFHSLIYSLTPRGSLGWGIDIWPTLLLVNTLSSREYKYNLYLCGNYRICWICNLDWKNYIKVFGMWPSRIVFLWDNKNNDVAYICGKDGIYSNLMFPHLDESDII